MDGGADWTLSSVLQLSGRRSTSGFTTNRSRNLPEPTFKVPPSMRLPSLTVVFRRASIFALFLKRFRDYGCEPQYPHNQIYTDYTEQLTTGSEVTNSFSRNSNRIPGVQPHYPEDAREKVIYDQPTGRILVSAHILKDWLGGTSNALDNANLLSAPGYTLSNLSTHDDPPAGHGALSRLRFFFDIQNLANKTYAGIGKQHSPTHSTAPDSKTARASWHSPLVH